MKDRHARGQPGKPAFAALVLAILIAPVALLTADPAPAAAPESGRSDGPRAAPQPWAEHGALRVSGDGHALEHADGTPFIWLGDTAWALHQNLRRNEVLRYLDDCAENGFTVIQLMGVNAWALKD